MRTISDIYTEYRIMPGLQMHQLRVAAVGKTICDNLRVSVDSHAVVSACLLHDMGNIIKSDLTLFPEFLEPLGFDYWSEVKKEYIEKYGTHEHHATIEIGKELGLSENVIALMDGVGFSQLETARDAYSMEGKIVEYADLRVAPHGIVSMDERLEEGRKRYEGRGHHDFPESRNHYDALVSAAHDVERQIFENTQIQPTDITEESLQQTISELRALPIVA